MGGLRRHVLKFGGTSVGAVAPLRSALSIVAAAALDAPVVVVVSALSGVTDALEAAAAGASAGRLDNAGFVSALRVRHGALLGAVAQGKAAARAAAVLRGRLLELEGRLRAIALRGEASPSARAAVLAAGERLSVPIAVAGLRALGLDAREVDAAALIRTDHEFAEARVDRPATRQMTRLALGALALGTVPVVAGFLGATEAGETTLLGRGGSDLTAAILGWAIDAARVEIWSDVDGVMSADPRLDPDARTIERLSYAEATALARAGAKVLHPRALEPLEGAGIPVLVGNTLRPRGPATWIGPHPAVEASEESGTAA